MSVEGTIKINDKIPSIKVMSDDKEKFLKEFYEQLKTTLSTIEDGAEILGVMRFRTFVTKMS